MYKGWIIIEEVPYCFQGDPLNFIARQNKKITIFFTQIERFQIVSPVWIHWWLWNDAQNLK